MKRHGNLIDSISSLDNIALGFWKALRGHRMSKEAKGLMAELHKNIVILQNALYNGVIWPITYNKFTISEPKERLICAPKLLDRVLHHCIMNVCHQFFDRQQIFDSYATRPGKGVYAALDRASYFSRKYKFYVKLDVRKYFDSVDHSLLKIGLRKIFKDDLLLKIFDAIIDSYNTSEGKGIPIGNLTSQYFANYYLSSVDHFMKEIVGVKAYVRYMDDVVMWAKDKATVRYFAKRFQDYLQINKLLIIKPAICGNSNDGIGFLGYRVFPYYRKLTQRSKRRFRQSIAKLMYGVKDGKINQEYFHLHAVPLLAFVCKAETLKLRRRLLSQLPDLG